MARHILNHQPNLFQGKGSGIQFLSREDMQEVKKSMEDKLIKYEDVKILPPIEEIHGLYILPYVTEVDYLCRFYEGDIPFTECPSQYLDEFNDFILKQENFYRYVSIQLKHNSTLR